MPKPKEHKASSKETYKPVDAAFEQKLRPETFEDYIGQNDVKRHLSIFLEAAKKRGESLEHVLLHGSPGLGKTTLAHIIAKEMGVGIRITSGPAIERAGDLAAILTNIPNGDILFIDEIHRLHHTVEEVLYPAMEDFALDLVLGKGPGARTLRLDLPRFTLIGATTKLSSLSSPFRGRFGTTYRLDFYSNEDIATILTRSARILGIELDDDARKVISERSRKTPRVANRLLKRVRDHSQVEGRSSISKQHAEDALAMLAIDTKGLEAIDRKILEMIVEQYQGGPVGIQALAAALGEEAATLEDVYEPFLLQEGFVTRTGRGRVATRKAYEHIGKKPPAGNPEGML